MPRRCVSSRPCWKNPRTSIPRRRLSCWDCLGRRVSSLSGEVSGG
jgi:hypothetical protein